MSLQKVFSDENDLEVCFACIRPIHEMYISSGGSGRIDSRQLTKDRPAQNQPTPLLSIHYSAQGAAHIRLAVAEGMHLGLCGNPNLDCIIIVFNSND